MKLSLAAVADAANVDADQKLSIFGVFDRIMAATFPVIHPSMALALRFTAEAEDSAKHFEIRIRLMDEDGRITVEAAAKLQLPTIDAGLFASAPLAIQVGGWPIPRPGRYHFEVSGDGLDGSPVQVPFIVTLRPAAL